MFYSTLPILCVVWDFIAGLKLQNTEATDDQNKFINGNQLVWENETDKEKIDGRNGRAN